MAENNIKFQITSFATQCREFERMRGEDIGAFCGAAAKSVMHGLIIAACIKYLFF